ncbi:histidine kinase [Pseudoalteromonas phenolica]|uniref:histidine kinase n=1 Tax=Pseudoalteromonas phenolica TaxID=161398 RepID=A0A5S3YTJ7_9GAMM|nr:ATP-binding protein [Pseudoalteromonas phenolica]TMP80751.1 histidine kinase [Pseudoalteromonas phenolica]
MNLSIDRLSTRHKLQLAVITSIVLVLTPILLLLGATSIQSLISLGFAICIGWFVSAVLTQSVNSGIQALETGLLNFKDGEFSSLLAYSANDELGRLCDVYNQTAEQLRQEKQWIYQRELMLDKVLQSSPQALVLIDSTDHVVFSNYSAKLLFNSDSKLEGLMRHALYQCAEEQVRQAMEMGRDGLFHLKQEQDETQTWHLSTGEFLLNNQQHKLYIFKQLTRELSRQEVAVWKKVIRIISHELNNSLGPMSSMLHSGQLLSKNLDEPRLGRVFSTMQERISHLNEFVQGYGKFAKLPKPKLEVIEWQGLLDSVQQQWHFTLGGCLPLKSCYTDKVQIEQLLINLLKNAHESGSAQSAICVKVEQKEAGTLLSVEDAGKGMNEAVMANALIPFYSTKASGSGLGLALCREIAEAHHGQLSLHNRGDGQTGLVVQVFIP